MRAHLPIACAHTVVEDLAKLRSRPNPSGERPTGRPQLSECLVLVLLQQGLPRYQGRAPGVLHCTFVRVTLDMIDTKTTIAFIVGILSGLLMAATALLPLWTAGSAIDTGSPVPESDAAPAIPAAEAVANRPPESDASPSRPPLGPAARLVAQRDRTTSLQAATDASVRMDSLTVTGTVADVWPWDRRIFVLVEEDSETTGALVQAAFDPQTWEEPLREIARGARVRVSGVNAVAKRFAVEMEGTQFERLRAATP